MTAAFFATHNYRSEATELNSLGTVLADQQMLKLAAEKVGEPYRLDPSLAIAEISQGIGTLRSEGEFRSAAQNYRLLYVSHGMQPRNLSRGIAPI